MKYTIETVDDNKVVETLEIQGNKFTATWERVEDEDSCFDTFKTIGKSLNSQIEEAFDYDYALAMDIKEVMCDVDFLSDKFLNFVEAWGE